MQSAVNSKSKPGTLTDQTKWLPGVLVATSPKLTIRGELSPRRLAGVEPKASRDHGSFADGG